MSDIKLKAGALTVVADTELNNLADAARALGKEFDNSVTLAEEGYFELDVTFGVAPAQGERVELYLIPAVDGVNYADGDVSVTPPQNHFKDVFIMEARVDQKSVVGPIPLPPCKFRPLLLNDAGQPFPAAGSTLTLLPVFHQAI